VPPSTFSAQPQGSIGAMFYSQFQGCRQGIGKLLGIAAAKGTGYTQFAQPVVRQPELPIRPSVRLHQRVSETAVVELDHLGRASLSNEARTNVSDFAFVPNCERLARLKHHDFACGLGFSRPRIGHLDPALYQRNRGCPLAETNDELRPTRDDFCAASHDDEWSLLMCDSKSSFATTQLQPPFRRTHAHVEFALRGKPNLGPVPKSDMARCAAVISQHLARGRELRRLPKLAQTHAADDKHREDCRCGSQTNAEVSRVRGFPRFQAGSVCEATRLQVACDIENPCHPLKGGGVIGMRFVPFVERCPVVRVVRAVQPRQPVGGPPPEPFVPAKGPGHHHRSLSIKRSIAAIALLICFSTPLTDRPVRSAISA
jgi:hypothetical protein